MTISKDFDKELREIWKSFWQPKMFSFQLFKRNLLSIIDTYYVHKTQLKSIEAGYIAALSVSNDNLQKFKDNILNIIEEANYLTIVEKEYLKQEMEFLK